MQSCFNWFFILPLKPINKEVFSSYQKKKKKKEVHLCSLKEEKETKAVLLHIQIIFVLAHFSSVTHKKCLFIMHSVKLDRINILMYVNIYLYKLLSLLCLKSHMNDVRSSIKIHFFVLYSVTHASKNLLCKTNSTLEGHLFFIVWKVQSQVASPESFSRY